ncbi:hypothetical protein M2359_003010 [Gordonia amarae]|uniref:hypothetical protein n=1 Tax=Gordonia amarae TaxID=36821 RepID=UPI00058C0152|nr:hypothetical protein [Gordonia amarae]MCS3879381.1 hypothetical protein [Gordonia amarae]
MATTSSFQDPVDLKRHYGLWNSPRHFCWNHAIPEAQSDDVDALAEYWVELRDGVRERRIARKVNIAARQGVIAEKVKGLWIPRYYAVKDGRVGVVKPIKGTVANVDGIECPGQAATYGKRPAPERLVERDGQRQIQR